MNPLVRFGTQVNSLRSKNIQQGNQQVIDTAKKTIVVVGNGMVGHAFCERMVKQKAMDKYQLVVFGDEPRPAYDRVNLTKYFSGASAEQLELAPVSWYQDSQIDLKVNQRVKKIDRHNKTVETENGNSVEFDQLVLATGSSPFVPPISGVDLPGVFVYRTIEDLESIKQYSKQSKSAAVLGGGLLGLEAGKALYDLQLDTHIVEMAPALMPRQLDQEGASILKDKIEQLGVHVHLIKRTTAIEQNNNQLSLQFNKKDSLEVDLVVISAGIRPRHELAEEAGLALGKRGGIAVNNQLQTSDPSIFAIGECASHNDIIYGLAGPGYQMANVLADRLMGEESEFVQGDLSCRLKLMDVAVTTMGEPLGESVDGAMVSSKKNGSYRKLIVGHNTILGAMSVGEWPEAERVRESIESKRRLWSWQFNRFCNTGMLWSDQVSQNVTQWPATATVCSCMGVTRGELTCALKEGCTTAKQLSDRTGASKVCGSCAPLLAELAGDSSAGATKLKIGLLVFSSISLCLAIVLSLINPIPFANSVQSTWYQFDIIWRDSFWKQVTGFTLVGLSVLAMLLSLRKRLKWISWGDYSFWRTAHTALGLLTLLGIVVHTGMHLGSNLNFMLAVTFLGLNLIGAVTGIATAIENKTTGTVAMLIRAWKPRLLKLHIWFLWPLPALLIFHIISVYYY